MQSIQTETDSIKHSSHCERTSVEESRLILEYNLKTPTGVCWHPSLNWSTFCICSSLDSSMMAFYKILDYVCGNLPIHPEECEWHWCWPGGTDTSLCLSSRQGYLMGLSQSSELANQHYSIPKWKNLTSWLRSIYEVLCTRENSHAGTGKGLPKLFHKSWKRGIISSVLVSWSITDSLHWNLKPLNQANSKKTTSMALF